MIDRRVFGLSLAALAAGCARGPSLDRLAVGETGRVASVRSGEVLVLENGLEVRLAGIEAPNGGEPVANEALAWLSRAALGQSVSLRYGGLRRDRYGRALAHVLAGKDKVWLQGKCLEAGFGRVHTYPDNRALAREMLAIEAEARAIKRGLWILPDYQVLLPYECPGRSGFQVVEGKVTQVAYTGNAVALDFLGGGARAEIAGLALDDFKAAGRGPDLLKDKLIRVRGNLRDGIVRLDHPETLELLRAA